LRRRVGVFWGYSRGSDAIKKGVKQTGGTAGVEGIRRFHFLSRELVGIPPAASNLITERANTKRGRCSV
jgi:hypothetical protein